MPPNGVPGRQIGDQRLDAVGDLVGELRRRRPPQGVDIAHGRLCHRRESIAGGWRFAPPNGVRPLLAGAAAGTALLTPGPARRGLTPRGGPRPAPASGAHVGRTCKLALGHWERGLLMHRHSLHEVRPEAFNYVWDNAIPPALEVDSGAE